MLAASVSGNFFTVLGARAAFGRTFLPAEDDEVGVRRVVLSDQAWRRRFGADPGVVGKTVRIDESPFEVVGVMRPDFLPPAPAEFWTLGDRGVPALSGFPGDLPAARDLHYFNVFARLRPGASIETARSELGRIAGELAAAYPSTNRDLGVNVLPLREAVVGDRSTATLLLLGVVGFVLLIAGANAANLMLASSAARGREFAIRAALGASRKRLAEQLLSEGCGIALVAGAMATIGAFVAVRTLERVGIIQLPAATPATIDLRVFLFTAAISIVVGIGASLVPALSSGKGSLGGDLRTRGADGGSHRRLRRGLAAFQLGLSLTLLNGAGLLLLGYSAVARNNPGFDAEGVATVSVVLSPASYAEGARMAQYYDRAIGALASMPEVASVAAVSNLPAGGASMDRGVRIEGRPAPERGTDQTIGAAAREAVRSIDPSQPVSAAGRLTDQLSASISRPRNLATLLASLAAIALILAAVGLYGVLSQLAMERTGEIGVRLALGATSTRIVAMILGDASQLVGAGILLGGAAALASAALVRRFIFGASPVHPGVLAAVVAVLSVVALVAAWVPARRAARLDPARVLGRSS